MKANNAIPALAVLVEDKPHDGEILVSRMMVTVWFDPITHEFLLRQTTDESES